MPSKTEFLKFNTIKEYINDAFKMRSSKGAVEKFISKFNSAIKDTLSEAAALAKDKKRNTLLEVDIDLAIEKHLGKRHLTWDETAKEIIRQNPTDLGNISKAINDYIEKEKGKK